LDFPCGFCNEECVGDSDIWCDKCNLWYHTKCENLSHADFEFLTSTELSYICRKCSRVGNTDVFDFNASLGRLNRFICNDKHLKESAKAEQIFLREFPILESKEQVKFDNWGLSRDATAATLLGTNWKGPVPVSVTGDGNCLFHAISVATTGYQMKSEELRLRTAIEMVLYKDYYVSANKHSDIALCSPDIDVAVNDCTQNKSFSSAWTMHAAASVIRRPIKSVYPVINGPADQCVSILNRVFTPREGIKDQMKEHISIMWSGPRTSKTWTPDHFVPLLVEGNACDNVLNIDDDEDFPPLIRPSKVKTERPSHSSNRSSDHDMSDADNEVNDSSLSDSHCTDHLDVTSLSDVDQPYKDPLTNRLNKKFLTAEKQLEILQSDNPKVTNIPRGIKQNVFFILEDTANTERRSMGKKSEYPDDCGSWKQGANVTKAEYFLKTQIGIQSIKRNKDGLYYRIHKKKNVALNPQPHNDHVICMKRKYSVLARQNEYRKRITWFEGGPYEGTAFAEFIGTFPDDIPSVHGNSKINNKPYQRMTGQQKDIITKGLEENKKPRQIKNEVRMALPDEAVSLKTIRNAKYIHEKKKYPEDKQNLADDVITILNKAYEDPSFVQEVMTSSSQKPPNIICYSEEQMVSLRSSISNGCILGIDRTFNVGSCYLTVITFKNPNIVREETSESPIMLGPVFLHWDGQYHTYQRFLSHLQSRLQGLDQSKIVFGSDGEKAVLNAIQSCFPNAVHTLCTRHLKENLTHNLRKTLPQPEATVIVNKIFNKQSGLLSIDDQITYMEVEGEIQEDHNLPYLTAFLQNVRKNVFLPRMKCKAFKIPKHWTNNNNESYNNIIKLHTNWQIQRLPELIQILRDLDQTQTQNVRDALHHRGEFSVTGPAQCLTVSDAVWVNMTQEQRGRRLSRLLNFITPSSVIKSTDGSLTLPRVARIAKKPGQVKRVKSCKSKSAPKRRKFDSDFQRE
ncbi:hypothetical protein FSP39_015680, partial [Pinctada imbricata]